jgi:hypothetical protein
LRWAPGPEERAAWVICTVYDVVHLFYMTASTDAMRTTFTLDDDAAQFAQTYAKARSLRLGKAISELIRKASAPPATLQKKGQFWVIPAPPGTPKLSSEQVKDMLDKLP